MGSKLTKYFIALSSFLFTNFHTAQAEEAAVQISAEEIIRKEEQAVATSDLYAYALAQSGDIVQTTLYPTFPSAQSLSIHLCGFSGTAAGSAFYKQSKDSELNTQYATLSSGAIFNLDYTSCDWYSLGITAAEQVAKHKDDVSSIFSKHYIVGINGNVSLFHGRFIVAADTAYSLNKIDLPAVSSLPIEPRNILSDENTNGDQDAKLVVPAKKKVTPSKNSHTLNTGLAFYFPIQICENLNIAPFISARAQTTSEKVTTDVANYTPNTSVAYPSGFQISYSILEICVPSLWEAEASIAPVVRANAYTKDAKISSYIADAALLKLSIKNEMLWSESVASKVSYRCDISGKSQAHCAQAELKYLF
ncbi:autotransporter beta-domain protein [Chlamydia ibidis]|uniref:Autotransporter beta-domain protein n=2 Tax=Chlamydia ibidis TaxID=1405396 RepID=S7J5E0_9CHLA|nr:autotransporter beta-domain protein [Chlamydia ibidis]EPP35448.1 autotransporter beta-domain protein [Chlamydia ibidis]EQM63068.1 autotransporter beta-domain protein [Chlamydia ibidis 10-1398/6]